MRSTVNALINILQKRDKSSSSLLFLSVFIFLQSVLFIPATGQNGISAFQLNPDRTEATANKKTAKHSSYSFLRIYFSHDNSFPNSNQQQIIWIQNQIKYSQKVDQASLFLRFSHHLPAFIFPQNVFHSNQSDTPSSIS